MVLVLGFAESRTEYDSEPVQSYCDFPVFVCRSIGGLLDTNDGMIFLTPPLKPAGRPLPS